MKDLTNSNIDRQNILNNHYALTQIQEYIGLPGMIFEGELKHNGYILTKGKLLKDFKLQFAPLIDKENKTK